MSEFKASEILAALEKIRDEGPLISAAGICRNVVGYLEVASIPAMHIINSTGISIMSELAPYWAGWPYYSGDKNYPISGGGDTMGCWDDSTPAGRLRQDLLGYMIRQAALAAKDEGLCDNSNGD